MHEHVLSMKFIEQVMKNYDYKYGAYSEFSVFIFFLSLFLISKDLGLRLFKWSYLLHKLQSL